MTGKSNTMRIDLIPEISDVPLSERPKASFVPGFKPSVASALTGRAPGPAIEAPPAPGPARSPDGYGELFQNIYDAAVITGLHGRIRLLLHHGEKYVRHIGHIMILHRGLNTLYFH